MMRAIPTRTTKVGTGLILALLACFAVPAQDVTTNSMPGVNFGKYHTYKWVTVEGASTQTDCRRSNQSLHRFPLAKVSKTYRTRPSYVAYQLFVNQEKQWNAYGMGGGLRWGGGMATAQSSTISIGTLVLDMYDPSTKQLVWTGRATKTLDPGANQEKKQKNLDKAMQKLLKSFPPS